MDRETKFCNQGKETPETEMLRELFASGVFELQKREEGVYDVPYLMNDALECVLVFTGASLSGEWLEGLEEETEGTLAEQGERRGLIIRQGRGNTCTLWFDGLSVEEKLYRFHEIGHFWEPGAEQWRRLVYMIGTMQDKYLFRGAKALNPKERELLPLMDFTPFCRYYPAKICIPDEYIMTEEGCLCMLRLSREAGDRVYAWAIRLYLRFPWGMLERLLHWLLLDARRGALYDLICRKAALASQAYESRDYGAKNNRRVKERRAKLEEELHRAGYEGAYPDFHRGTVWVQAAEEHPFARMEDFEEGFRIRLMVSDAPGTSGGPNRGFFRGRRRRGRILEPEELLAERSL